MSQYIHQNIDGLSSFSSLLLFHSIPKISLLNETIIKSVNYTRVYLFNKLVNNYISTRYR